MLGDTAGDEKFRSVIGLYYKDANAAVMVFDVTSKESFDDLGFWIQELNDKVNTQGLILKLVGNKIDSPKDEIQVSEEMARKYAKEHNLLISFCSAKTGEGIDLVFKDIIEEFSQRFSKNQE